MNGRINCLVFADDFAGAGKLQELRSSQDSIVSHGPNVGYYPEERKSWFTVKEQYFENAIKIFKGTSVQVTVEGTQHSGAIIRSKEYKE